MSGHRRYMRKRCSESSSSHSRSRSSMRASPSTTDTETDDDVHGGHRRRHKRPSASLPLRRSPASSHRSWSWVLLNRTGADDFCRDRTTSAMSRTSRGEEISISFELAEPPGTSVLAFHLPPAALTTTQRTFSANVVAAHRDVVLLAITSYSNDTYRRDTVVDLFVYQWSLDPGSRRRRPPSLLLLPSAGGPEIYAHCLDNGEIGIMSCASNDDDDDSPSFVVAEHGMWRGKGNDVHLFQSGSGHWVSFKNLHVHGANGGRDMRYWKTDAVVPYGRRRMMIWVDYYRGMLLMDLSSSEAMTTNPPPPPRFRHVALPVDRVGDPKDAYFDQGCPKACRRVCVTRHGVKFVSVDTQHCSNYGVGHANVLTWSHRFRITTWTLREDDYTWRRDVTMHEEEFWDAFDGGDRFPFPHVQPTFPVVDVDNPDVIVFRLEKDDLQDHDEPKWMIEVDLRKKVMLAATSYSTKKSDCSYGAGETINSARMKFDLDLIPSELPRYLDAGQGCKKRRQ